MKFVTFVRGQGVVDAHAMRYGVHLGASILDLQLAAVLAGEALAAPDLISFIAAGEPALRLARRLSALAIEAIDAAHSKDGSAAGRLGKAVFPAREARLLAPIPRPAKNVFCVGRNYRDHVVEGSRARGAPLELPEYPQFFTKPPTAVIGPDDVFHHDPKVTEKLDYEVELGVVIGASGCDISPQRALDHVFGYTVVNDLTARDLQRRHEQWFKGKGLDRSCPLGPWIVTADEILDPSQLELSLSVNGEERQRARASAMIFDIPAIIASLSAGLTLEPGDIIATGTPSGVGYAMTPPQFLAAGDTVTCDISGIGRLSTRIVSSPHGPETDA
ncbi:MAG TPA: fumarylacetoacetate hydrolase family protein [Polyangiaceae bacterium]|nr:fumarylacetoacetate hydrolase family protein [Polyangiaceae bacterium]